MHHKISFNKNYPPPKERNNKNKLHIYNFTVKIPSIKLRLPLLNCGTTKKACQAVFCSRTTRLPPLSRINFTYSSTRRTRPIRESPYDFTERRFIPTGQVVNERAAERHAYALVNIRRVNLAARVVCAVIVLVYPNLLSDVMHLRHAGNRFGREISRLRRDVKLGGKQGGQ
eukprot:GEMP01095647.1.p1 GENE.GEMP01095647.1~~GEMP01095647.1.p1  ORF type:complete len:171 (-),score=17.87 GEMP01095647.1:206-718(-)